MNTKEQTQIKLNYLTTILVVVVFILCLINALFRFTSIGSTTYYSNDNLVSLNSGWVLTSDNSNEEITLPASIDSDTQEVTISKKLTAEEGKLDTLLFYETRNEVTVNAFDNSTNEGIELFTINTNQDEAKRLLVSSWCIAEIPANYTDTTISITIKNPNGTTIDIPEIELGTKYSASQKLLGIDSLVLVSIILFALMTIALIIMTIIGFIQNIKEKRLYHLAILLLIASAWGFCDSSLGLVGGLNAQTLGFLDYIMLMLIPFAPIRFIQDSLSKNYKILNALVLVICLEIFVQLACYSTGTVPLNAFMYVDHGLIIGSLFILLGCSIKDYQLRPNTNRLALLVDIVFFIALAIISFCAYWFFGGDAYRSVMLVGLALFTLGLFGIVVFTYTKDINTRKIQKKELEIYQTLSSRDQLTGLDNRRKFDELLDEIDKRDKSLNATLIIFDLNGLKYVNDFFGHNTGDDLIVSAARAIEKTYSNQASCFRIGGDEFAVIFKKVPLNLLELEAELEKLQKLHNETHEYQLSLAYGASNLISSAGIRKTISDWKQASDVNMYRNKRTTQTKQNVERNNEFREITRMVITMEEAKDPYTAHHSDRVRILSSFLASRFGLSASTILQIEEAATLHDIGKVGISDKVLTKEGKLTDEEYEEIKLHPVIGARILSNAKTMHEITDIVLHHHERYDGKGYPDGLKGDNIPLGARIVAIADSIDAMTSSRCYRGALPISHCYNEIKRNSGLMYDPALVQITLENWREITAIIIANSNECIDD